MARYLANEIGTSSGAGVFLQNKKWHVLNKCSMSSLRSAVRLSLYFFMLGSALVLTTRLASLGQESRRWEKVHQLEEVELGPGEHMFREELAASAGEHSLQLN